VIDREARALAAGDRTSLEKLWNFADFEEQQQRMAAVQEWGTATDRPLYDILDFGLLSDDSAWVEVRQYRNGDDFRETRFYRLQHGQWQRAEADGRFWRAEQQTADTPHFRIVYAAEDREQVARVLTQLEQDYEQICADFACPVSERHCMAALGRSWCSVYAPEYTPTLKFSGATANVTPDGLIFELPSPRLMGLYESQQPIHYGRDTIYLMAVPFSQMWYLAYEKPDFSSIPYPLANQPLVYALTWRELEHLQAQRGVSTPQWATLLGESSDYTDIVYLESLWLGPASQSRTATRMLHAYWFIEFLEQEFGKPALVKLLQNMRVGNQYEAFPAITGLPFDQVQQRWDAWVKSRTN
jgi:hypothetical protein